MAGDATELAKPVMGTSVPAPAYRASLWYSPSPVNSAERNTSAMDAAVPACSRSSPSRRKPSRSACPRQQMAPPVTKASAVFFHTGEGGFLLLRKS